MRVKSDYKREATESKAEYSWINISTSRRTTEVDFAEWHSLPGDIEYFVSELEPKAEPHRIVIYYEPELPKYRKFVLNEWKRLFKKSKSDKDEHKVGLPVPENIEPLLTDLLTDTGEKIMNIFSALLPKIRDRMKSEEVVTKLDDLQIVFGLAKKPYSVDTLNFEVYNEIQNKLIELIVAVQKEDHIEENKLASDLTETLETIVKTNKDLGKSNIPLTTLRDTGRRIGGLRIFTPSET